MLRRTVGTPTHGGRSVIWSLSHRADPAACAIADRHYNRQKVGSPQFVPPGRCLVLRFECAEGRGVWVTSWPFAEFTKHAWAGAWVNSCFRNESSFVASELIRSAIALQRWRWPEVPSIGMITFVDASKVQRKRTPGRVYKIAGFKHVGYTKGGLWAWQILPNKMPAAAPPRGSQESLFNGGVG